MSSFSLIISLLWLPTNVYNVFWSYSFSITLLPPMAHVIYLFNILFILWQFNIYKLTYILTIPTPSSSLCPTSLSHIYTVVCVWHTSSLLLGGWPNLLTWSWASNHSLSESLWKPWATLLPPGLSPHSASSPLLFCLDLEGEGVDGHFPITENLPVFSSQHFVVTSFLRAFCFLCFWRRG